MINCFGFYSSATEDSKYRTHAATVKVLISLGYVFVEVQADNVDHTSIIFDCYGSIHVMGQNIYTRCERKACGTSTNGEHD